MSNSNPIATSSGVSADLGQGRNAPTPTPVGGGGKSDSDDHQEPNIDNDLRLVIEEDEATGGLIYKTVNRRTGEIISQRPVDQILRLRDASDYVAGAVIKTRA